ncbi:hypothetical protein [Tsuneonella aeria]|nr:hypothetical protein [Tsuneonella aeria]
MKRVVIIAVLALAMAACSDVRERGTHPFGKPALASLEVARASA